MTDEFKSSNKRINKILLNSQHDKYLRFYFDSSNHETSEISNYIFSLTNLYADDFIPKVTDTSNVFYVVSDESGYKEYYCVSAVVFFVSQSHKQALDDCEAKLEKLCEKYGVEEIHFTEIIGRKILKNQTQRFLQEYIEIVKPLNLWACSFSVDRQKFTSEFKTSSGYDCDIHFQLYWNLMDFIVEKVPENSVFNMYFERENNLSVNLINKNIDFLHSGIATCDYLKQKNISISRNPIIFTKKALCFSSVADLAAYSNNKIQQKIDKLIPIKMIQKKNRELINTTKEVFKFYSCLSQSRANPYDEIFNSNESLK